MRVEHSPKLYLQITAPGALGFQHMSLEETQAFRPQQCPIKNYFKGKIIGTESSLSVTWGQGWGWGLPARRQEVTFGVKEMFSIFLILIVVLVL